MADAMDNNTENSNVEDAKSRFYARGILVGMGIVAFIALVVRVAGAEDKIRNLEWKIESYNRNLGKSYEPPPVKVILVEDNKVGE